MKSKRRLSKQEIKKKYDESAGNFKRLVAYVIDWYVTSLFVMVPVALLYSIETGKKALAIDISLLSLPYACVSFVIGLVLSIYYLVYSPLKTGQTLGKRAMSIKIVKMNGNDIDLKTMVIRQIVGIVLIEGVMFTVSTYFHEIVAMLIRIPYSNYIAYVFTAVLVVSIIIAIIKPEKRMIHDYLAGTKVIALK